MSEEEETACKGTGVRDRRAEDERDSKKNDLSWRSGIHNSDEPSGSAGLDANQSRRHGLPE